VLDLDAVALQVQNVFWGLASDFTCFCTTCFLLIEALSSSTLMFAFGIEDNMPFPSLRDGS
jgi:hypothetical protein